jgi:hypothetical protein
MLAKIAAAAAMTILLAGSALASGSTVSRFHGQQTMNSDHNIYAGPRNGVQRHAANTVLNGYNDERGSHALDSGPG